MTKESKIFKTRLLAILAGFLIYNNVSSQVTTQTFVYTGTIQNFTVPLLCVNTITIEAIGAGGGSVTTSCVGSGGLGASMKGQFTVTPGQVLSILVGQAGISNGSDAGGGGGSFVATGTVPLVVGGGGGGATNNVGSCGANRNGLNAVITTGGTASGNNLVAGGVNGNGGGASSGSGGGGGGFYTNGTAGSGNAVGNGKSFLNGGAGGTGNGADHGGFGGGGCGWQTGGNGGGGGGYSGGATSGSSPYTGGGGGGSYNAGTSQVNTAGVRAGNGLVIISYNVGTPISVSASSLALCNGATVGLTASGMVSYTWNTGSNASSITVAPAVNTSYTVQGTNAQGCISTSVVNLTVNATVPVLSIVNTASANICPGKTATLTGSGATSYTWSGGVTNGVSFVPPATAVYTLSGSNACGTSSATTNLTINPTPTVTATASTASLCSGSSATLTGGGAVSYTWSPVVTNGVGFFPNATVTYTVIGTSALGCTNTAVATISVVTTPIAPPSITPILICNNGSTATLTASGASNYTWLPGNQNTSVIVVSPTTTTTYTVIKSNANCSNTQTINLLVNQLPPVFTIASPTSVCAFGNSTLSGGGALTYSWAPFGGVGANVLVTPSVTTIFTVSASDGTCINTSTVQLVARPNPTINIVASSSVICVGQTATMTANSATGSLTYTWTSPASNQSSVVASPPSTTLITVAGTNTFGCTSSVSQPLIVNPNPVLNVTTNKPLVCVGFPAILTVSGANTYTWVNTATTNTTVVNPTTATFFSVVGTFSSTGCQSSGGVLVSVYDPTFTVPSSASTCIGGTVTLVASGAQTYTWSTNQQGPAIAVSPTIFTIYSVNATSTPSNGVSCVNSQTIGVSIYLNPTVTAVSERSIICRNEFVTLTGGGASTYTWTAPLVTLIGTTVSVNPLSPTVYSVTGKDINGCVGTNSLQVKVITCTGIGEPLQNQDMMFVYPNPNNGSFTIQGEREIELSIINELGQTIQSIRLSAQNNYRASVMDIAKGIYFVVGKDDSTIKTQKIIVSN